MPVAEKIDGAAAATDETMIIDHSDADEYDEEGPPFWRVVCSMMNNSLCMSGVRTLKAVDVMPRL
jgi:hypothetical protein